MICKNCGKKFNGNFCPSCGIQMRELTKCPICGFYINNGDRFCANCGYAIANKITTKNVDTFPKDTEKYEDVYVTNVADFKYKILDEGICITGYNGQNKQIIIPQYIDNKKVKSLGISCFKGLDITNVIIQDGVTSIDDIAFQDCHNLTNIKLPSSITSIGYGAFQGCKSLANIEIPNYVTHIDARAFCNCSSLTNIRIPNGVKYIKYGTFSDCSNLESVEMSENVTSIEAEAFRYCSKLKNIEIPSNVTKIGEKAFQYCSNLKRIFIPISVMNMEKYIFFACNYLTIYCEASSQPSGWSHYWNYSNSPVAWGYKREQ